MSYTVLGFFKDSESARKAHESILDSGYTSANVNYIPYKSTGEYKEYDYEYQEDEATRGFWDNLFGDDEETRRKYSRLGSRSHLVTVYTDSKAEAERVQSLMDEVGALDPDEYDRAISQYNKKGLADNNLEDFNKNIEVIREELSVGKETVETGGVRVRSRIVEKPVEEEVRLVNERVYVKRNKVDKPVSGDEFDHFYEGTITLTETEERPVVTKEARVVEEIELGKEVNVETTKIEDTVRETEVDIDRDGISKDV